MKILIWICVPLLTGICSLAQPNTCRDSNTVQRYYASQHFERSRNIPLQDGGSLTWGGTEDNVLQTVPMNLIQQATVFTTEEVCKEINTCEAPVISGPDSICLSATETLFTVHKNVQCFKNINWTIDTGVVQTTRIVNDTTIGIVFKTNWESFIIADINGSCQFLRDSLQVVVYQNIPVQVSGNDTSLCTGDTITLRAGNGSNSYTWSTGATTGSMDVWNKGKYWLRVSDARGCVGSDTIVIKDLHPLPSQFLPDDISFCLQDSYRLQPAASYPSCLWSNGATTPFTIVEGPGQYWLTVTNEYGCTGTDSVTVSTRVCKKKNVFPQCVLARR